MTTHLNNSFPNKKYKIIVVDPPWPVDFVKRKARPNQKSMPYELMSMDEIKKLPINIIADDECYLFLWTTQKFIIESFEVLKTWGFKYHCVLTWDKNDGMVMFGFRRRTEFVIVGHKGKMNFFDKGKPIETMFYEKLKKNSQKPDIFYSMLAKRYPGPRIDMFARTLRHGWDVWGNDEKLQNQPLESFT